MMDQRLRGQFQMDHNHDRNRLSTAKIEVVSGQQHAIIAHRNSGRTAAARAKHGTGDLNNKTLLLSKNAHTHPNKHQIKSAYLI